MHFRGVDFQIRGLRSAYPRLWDTAKVLSLCKYLCSLGIVEAAAREQITFILIWWHDVIRLLRAPASEFQPKKGLCSSSFSV